MTVHENTASKFFGDSYPMVARIGWDLVRDD